MIRNVDDHLQHANYFLYALNQTILVYIFLYAYIWICDYNSGVLVLFSLAVFQSNELDKENNWAVMIMSAELIESCIRFLFPVSWHGNLNVWVSAMAGSRKSMPQIQIWASSWKQSTNSVSGSSTWTSIWLMRLSPKYPNFLKIIQPFSQSGSVIFAYLASE